VKLNALVETALALREIFLIEFVPLSTEPFDGSLVQKILEPAEDIGIILI